jgi:6,7-dimethyl-8-ribityllumazine synthase
MAKHIIDTKDVDLIICLWVVIKWDTPHFDYVCAESARWIMNLTINSKIPLMNGIITCFSEKQVIERLKPVYALSGLNTLVAYNQ